jgi:hypothetical protein
VGEGEKQVPCNNKNLPKGLRKEKRKSQPVLTKLVSTGTGGDGKRKPINAPSIQNGALVGAGSRWPFGTLIINNLA